MRVVAGSARGRRLQAPPGAGVRPTTDRVREATFNALVSLGVVSGARVLDAFAGSGALGIEACSRGAEHVTFVERDAAARGCIEANLGATGFADPARTRVVAATVESFLAAVPAPGERFDLVVCDPPYAFAGWDELWPALDAWTAPEGVVVTESDRAIEGPDTWRVARSKRYGGTVVSVHVRAAEPPRSTGAEH